MIAPGPERVSTQSADTRTIPCEYVRSQYEKKFPLNWQHYAITPLLIHAIPARDI